MVAESSWVSVLTVECLQSDRKPFTVEFSGGFLSYHLFHWLSLHLGLSVCFLVSCLACLFFLAVGSIYQDVIQSLHFHFFILKIQKNTFFILAFSLWVV
jgi:hypothetical protein